MLERIKGSRLLSMVDQEKRWMDNLKKAFYESDVAYTNGTAVDNAFPAISKAVDVASTLALSRQQPAEGWEPPSTRNNKHKFIAFLHSEIPDADDNGVDLTLIDARSKEPVRFNFGGIVYTIRCMVHENENLNADERPDYHLSLDWNIPRHGLLGILRDGRLTCNAKFVWWTVREVLANFILGTEMFMAYERGERSFSLSSNPELKSIFPGDGRHKVAVDPIP